MKEVRCAIYTRKSSEEGLEQGFNSLHAQREACAAYVLSQASEGWTLLPGEYDDGGLSGGTLERPALQQLLADIAAGKIDIVVVYKVDRLTRSLLDFAKLVEAFDKAGTSFVSITQSFNTTTSMGRLTLNMLLSFAQFEREVTAERIRDKLAASKAKGMWMGGMPPLGYKPDGRSLAIVESNAELVRDIFARYKSLGNVRELAAYYAQQGILVPSRTAGTGRKFGGNRFTRGQLYAILKNPIYAGDIPHKDKVYPGNHPAIIDRKLFDAVQRQLAGHVKGQRGRRSEKGGCSSALAGKIFDEAGEPLLASHTTRRAQRYRYYVSKALHFGNAEGATSKIRLPAREVEQAVAAELAALFADPVELIELAGLLVHPAELAAVAARCREIAAELQRAEP
jgi:site-specific DNA recombinase